MEGVHFNFWSLIILVCAIHGLFLTAVFWSRGGDGRSNRLFALLLLAISLHLVEYALCISAVIFHVPHLLFATYPLLFIIGPVFYFYVQTFLNADYQIRKLPLHLVPFTINVVVLFPFYLLSGTEKIEYFLNVADNHFQEVPLIQFLFMLAQALQMLIYLTFSYRTIYKTLDGRVVKGKLKLKKIYWLKQLTIAFGGFVIIYALVTVVLIFSQNYRIEMDYVVVLLLSLLIYSLGYIVLDQPSVLDPIKRSHKTNSIDFSSYREQLLAIMTEDRPYLSEHLKIEDLANALGIPIHLTSDLINQQFGVNFFEFVNSYRVEEAKKLLRNSKLGEKKILAIAFESGFGNKATFNRVFRDLTNLTPSQYRKQSQRPSIAE